MKITLNKIYISKKVIAHGQKGPSNAGASEEELNEYKKASRTKEFLKSITWAKTSSTKSTVRSFCLNPKCKDGSCKEHGDLDIPEAQLTAANKKLSDRFSEKFKK